MDRVVSHAELKELLGAYSLHALEDDETTLVDDHLAGCAECAVELDDLFEVAAALGSVAETTAPPAIWDRIRAEVAATAGAEGVDSADPVPNSTTRVTAAPASSRVEGGATNDRVAPVLALDAAREARRFRRSGLRMALGAAAAAAAIAVPLTASFTSGAAPSLAALANRATGEPGAVTVSLKDPAGRAIARAVVTASGKGYMLSDSLPALPAGKTYQLWAVTGADGPVSAGLLGRDPGVSAFTVDAPATALAITVEPAAGSIRGTTTAVALGTTA